MDPVVIMVIGFVILAVLAFFFARDSRPGFDHRELRDPGPPNVPSSPQPVHANDTSQSEADNADDQVPPVAPAST